MKRKCIAILSVFILVLSPLFGTAHASATANNNSSTADWPSGLSVNAESAVVIEASTGLILYEKNINEEHYPASITKIMTVLLALENSSLGDVVTFSKNAVYDVEADSSRLWVTEGEQMTMQQCLYAIMLASANDVAYGVAEHISGSVEDFAKLMTEKAKSLGCKNTNFMNPHGLQDDNHYTSAYDMALITQAAMKNDTFRKIFGTRNYTIPATNLQTETRPLSNHHKLVSDQIYHYDDVIGGKTGYTTTSKYTLVTVAKRGDLELICVIMKDDSIEHEYTDTQNLLDFGFDNFSIYPIANLDTSDVLNESPLFTRYNSLLSKTDTPIVTDENGFLVLPNTASFKDAQKEVSFYTSDNKSTTNAESSDSSKENVIGKISYTYDGKYVGGADILYKSVESPVLIQSKTNTKNPTPTPIPSSTKSSGSLRPIIIGGIVGLIILAVGVYFVLVERPRLKRRHAYYKKRAQRKLFKGDDFLDL